MWHPKAQFPERLKNSSMKEKIAYFNEGFVLNHSMIEVVHRTLLSDFVDSPEHLIALVTGPTGIGKSRLSLVFLADIYKDYDGVSEDHIINELPAIWVEAAVHSSTFSWRDFYGRILDALYEMANIRVYGRPRVEGVEKGRVYSTKNRTEADLRKDVEQRLKDLKTVFILIDEVQHIFKYGGKIGEKNLDILKSLSNITGCRIVGFGTYESSFTIRRSAQLARRTKLIEFPPYNATESASWKNFVSAYMGLLAHIPMQLDKTLSKEVNAIFIGACGCVGILKDWCQRAMTRALKNKDEVLGFEHFKETRLSANDLRNIAEEIKEGRALFAEPDDDEVIELLGGFGGARVRREQEVSNDKTKNKTKPGKRKPGRDAVG